MSNQIFRPSKKNNSAVYRLLYHLFYIVVSLLTLGPILWIITLSFKTGREYTTNPFGLPESLVLENYTRALFESEFFTFLGNSIFVTLAALVIILVVSTLAGYALARIPFKGASVLFAVFILCDAIPIFVLIIPLFVLIHMMGLSDSLWGLIFAYSAMRIGMSVMLMRGFFRSIPFEMEDAARIDGCNLLQNLWYIMLPIVRPGLLVNAIVNFIFLWNEYYLATVLLPRQSMFTIPPGLAAAFMGQYATNWPVMAAGFTLSFLPVLLIFIFAQDKIVAGWAVTNK